MRRYWRTAAALCLALCLSLTLFPAPALAADPLEDAPAPEEPLEETPAREEAAPPEEERAEAAEETPAEGAEAEAPAPEEPEMGHFEADLIQAGSLTGPQTLPDGIALFSAYDETGAMNAIYQGLKAKSESIPLSEYQIPVANLFDLYSRVVNDHPELFYVNTGCGYSYNGNMVVNLIPSYHNGQPMKVNDKLVNSDNLITDQAQRDFDNAANAALAQVNDQMSPLEKALVLHDYLVTNCGYNWEVGTNQEPKTMTVFTSYGALVNGDAVCQGYALAYKYLLNQAGITAVTVSSSSMNHMWNQVHIGSKWYHVDATWDDPTADTPGTCRHDNFLLSDTGITNTKHHDWANVYSCDDSKYESGYAFNSSYFPMLWENGEFYYLQGTNDCELYKGTLEEQGVSLTSFNRYMNTAPGGIYSLGGIVWLNGCLYYVNSNTELKCYSLLGYGEKSVGTIQFTPQGSFDGHYGAAYDGIGLQYRNGKIQAISPTRPNQLLAEFAPVEFDYPPDWAAMDQGICGLTNDSSRAGIKWNGSDTNAVLYCASYNEYGRLTSIKPVSVTLKNGVNVVDITRPGASTFKLFLASQATPLCAAWTPTS